MTVDAKAKYLSFLDGQEGCRIYRDFKRFIYGPQDVLVAHLYKNFVVPHLSAEPKAHLHLADIGGGDGGRVTTLLENAHDDFPDARFSLDFVEPSETAFARAQETFSTIKDHTNVTGWNARLEEAPLQPKSFDLVLLIHSIFTFSSDETIRRIASLKKDGGQVLVVANHPQGLLKNLNAQMHAKYQTKRYELTDFMNDLTRLNIPSVRQEQQVDFVVAPKAFNDFAGAILSMTSMGEYASFSPKEKEKSHDFLKSLGAKRADGSLRYRETEVILSI